MKMFIEVNGGVVSNIVATEDVEIHIIDHDMIKDGQGLEETVGDWQALEEAQNGCRPDRMCNGVLFTHLMSSALKPYLPKEYA